MRSAPLTTIRGGISRLRTKGGARADTLYDLLNGYVTEAGTVVVRPGTRRVANLDPLTRGLCAFGSTLYTFCHQAVAVPDGYALGILAHPPIEYTGELETPESDYTPTLSDPAAFITQSGRLVGATTETGYKIDLGGTSFGSSGNPYLNDNLYFWRLYAVAANGTPDSQYQLVASLQNAGAPASIDEFVSVGFTGADAVFRTFARIDADDPDGVIESDAGGDFRTWRWTVDPPAFLFAEDPLANVTLTTYYGVLTGGDTPSEVIPLKKVHFAEPFMGGLYVVAEFENGNVYHYWLQPGEVWAPETVYKAGTLVEPAIPTGFAYRATRYGAPYSTWAPNVPRSSGDGYDEQSIVEPTVYNDFYYKAIETTGTNPSSGTTEPVWPESEGATVVERTDGDGGTLPVVATPPPTNIPSTPTRERYGLFGSVVRRVVKP